MLDTSDSSTGRKFWKRNTSGEAEAAVKLDGAFRTLQTLEALCCQLRKEQAATLDASLARTHPHTTLANWDVHVG